jgi:hypothetical protein
VSFGECPNQPPCGHFWHDIYDYDDPYPTCCEEGCRCGHPGEAVIKRHDDGTLTVEHADPVIRVSRELLDEMAAARSPQWDPTSEVLLLDTAGTFRYEYLRPDPADVRVAIFGRSKP